MWIFLFVFQVNAASPSTIIVVSNAILKSESLSSTQQRIMAWKLLEKVQWLFFNALLIRPSRSEQISFHVRATPFRFLPRYFHCYWMMIELCFFLFIQKFLWSLLLTLRHLIFAKNFLQEWRTLLRWSPLARPWTLFVNVVFLLYSIVSCCANFDQMNLWVQ